MPKHILQQGAHAPTMEDVADVCGITKSTVSRALRHPEKVSPATREKVEQAMEKLGYVYNPLASWLSQPRQNLLGVMYSLRHSAIYPDTLALIETLAGDAGYETMFAMTSGLPAKEKETLLRMRQYQASAFVCLEASPEAEEMLVSFQREGYPCLLLHQTSTGSELNYVGPDLYEASRIAVDELAALGHGRIALVLGTGPGQHIAEIRQKGYREALERNAIEYDPQLVRFLGALSTHSWQPLISTARSAMSQMLSMDNPPTSAVVPNSSFAVGLLGAIQAAGLRVSEDFSIIVLQEDELGMALTPQMTSVDIDKVQQQILLSTFLQHYFKGEPLPGWRHTLPLALHRRSSSGTLRA